MGVTFSGLGVQLVRRHKSGYAGQNVAERTQLEGRRGVERK